MNEIGIDISKHKTKSVDNFLTQEFDFVITVCDGARETCPVFLGKVKHRLHIGFDDPAGQTIDVFRQVRDEIKQKMTEFMKQVEDKDESVL
jgi:arsenate reductase